MLSQLIVGAVLATAVSIGPVLACEGEEIFSDDFSDVTLSRDMWGGGDFISIEKGFLQIKNKPGYAGLTPIPLHQPEFDACVDVIYPAANKPDGTHGGFAFWFKDWDNYYEVITTPAGGLGAFRSTKGRLLALGAFKIYPALKKGTGEKNTIRLSVKGNTGTVYGNGQRLMAFRAVAADAQAATIGVALKASSEADQENAWRFTNVKLTEPPK